MDADDGPPDDDDLFEESVWMESSSGSWVQPTHEHASTLQTVFNMGLLHFNAGKKAAAKPLFVRAAKGFATSLGPAHPNTVKAQQYLARCG